MAKLSGPESYVGFKVINQKAQLIINKKDKEGNPISGAEFTLSLDDGTGNPIIKESKNGQVSFENLANGTYILTEIKAPPGYEKLKVPAVTFEVTDKGEVTNIAGNPNKTRPSSG